MSLLEKLKSWFVPPQPLKQEMLHYQTPPDAAEQYRLHLRIEPDGRGLLVINATTVLHLNQTATEYARLLLREADEDQVVRTITRRYAVGPAQARADYRRLQDHILTVARTIDIDPVTYMDMERTDLFLADTSAPYRVDLALTYRVDEAGTLDPEARRRVDRELSTAEWKGIMDQLWKVMVPHVVFTGGEPTLREDLVELVRHAEEVGFVSGLLTDGRRLSDWAVLEQLLLAGLDHLQISLVSHLPQVHDAQVGQAGACSETIAGLRNALAGDIYVVVHIVVTPQNAAGVVDTVGYLAELGVPAVALSSPLRAASAEESGRLKAALQAAREAVYDHGLTLIWDLATPYSRINPIELEAGLSPEQVVRQYLYIEPDGDVLPAQGYNIVLGNILRDPWEGIWGHPQRHNPAG